MKRKKQPKKSISKAPPSKRSHRAGKALSSISSKIYFAVVILSAIISSILYMLVIVIPEQERSQRYLDFVFSNYAELAEASVTAVSKRLEVIARTSDVVKSFEKESAIDVKALELSLSKILPKAKGVRLIHIGTNDIDETSNPPISNVTLELMRNSSRGQKAPPEVVKVGKPDQYIAMVENVVNANNEIVGYVLAGVDVSIINDGLKDIRSIPGYIEFRQEFSGTVHILGSVGDAALKQGEPLNISSLENSLWQMAYWPTPDEDFSAGDEQMIFIAGLVVIFLLISVLGFLGYKKINDTLSADASLFMRLILNNPDGNIDVPRNGFILKVFFDMAYTLKRTLTERDKILKTSHEPTAAIPQITDLDEDSIEVSPPSESVKRAASVELETEALDVVEEIEEEEVTPSTLPASIFRAYDIRGIVGETLTIEGVRRIGQAIGSEAFERGEQTVIVARDGRTSGPELIQALKEGLLSSGRDVIDIGMVPTPLLYFATHYLESRSGVMLTGSHNPAEYNGLKVVIAGDSLFGDDITGLYNRITSRNLLSGEGRESSKDIMADYVNNITGDIALTQPLKVVIDAGNGIAGAVAPILFQALGCEVIGLHCEVDGNFPNHHPDPSKPENLQDLQDMVLKEKADIGIAFDGDGDRIGIVDSHAKIIWPDKLMMLFSKDVLSRHPGADIIFDVKCSRHLKGIIKANNGRPIMWRTGHSYIKAKMKETGALLAGEQSGHIFFKERWYGFDDGLYAGARLLEILSNEMAKSAEIFDELPESISTPELTIEMADDVKFDFIDTLVSEGDFAGGKLTDIDGLRIDYSTGWGLVRASNTTPCLVLRFEAEGEQDLLNIQAVFRQQLLRVNPDLVLPF
ncbi:MAG: phosphoglucomutase [Gammaproteobacteria bacterium]|nr:MAG: phosphoglucomutase [Gammaproteobacteria bacterium]